MKKMRIWNKEVPRGLLGEAEGCSVKGCTAHPTLVMAGDESGTTRMCLRHAEAWSESSLCKDVARYNSSASSLALSTWLDIAQAGGLAAELA